MRRISQSHCLQFGKDFFKMKFKCTAMFQKKRSVPIDSYLLAEYSKQNDTVFALSKENKHWKAKYVEGIQIRRKKDEKFEAEVQQIKAKASEDMKTEGDRYRILLEETRRKERQHALEFHQAEEKTKETKEELRATIKDIRFQHGLEKIRLEEEYNKETKTTKEACDKVLEEKQNEKNEFEEEMNAKLEQAWSETRRLKSAVAQLKEEKAVAKAVLDIVNETYIKEVLKEKDERYGQLMVKFTDLSNQRDRLVEETEHKELRMVMKHRSEKAELRREAEEKMTCSQFEKEAAIERERAIIDGLKSRVAEIKERSEREIEELKRSKEEAIERLTGGFEERERWLKVETKQRVDELESEIANQVHLREQVERMATLQSEKYQKLVEEKTRLEDALENEKNGRATDKSNALREKKELLDSMEQQKVKFLEEKNNMLTEMPLVEHQVPVRGVDQVQAFSAQILSKPYEAEQLPLSRTKSD